MENLISAILKVLVRKTQGTFTCSESTIETPEMVLNLFNVNNKNTRTTSMKELIKENWHCFLTESELGTNGFKNVVMQMATLTRIFLKMVKRLFKKLNSSEGT